MPWCWQHSWLKELSLSPALPGSPTPSFSMWGSEVEYGDIESAGDI